MPGCTVSFSMRSVLGPIEEEGPGLPAFGGLRHPPIEEEGPGSPAFGGLRHPPIEGEGLGSPAFGGLRHPLGGQQDQRLFEEIEHAVDRVVEFAGE
jgi:hypothetical protein